MLSTIEAYEQLPTKIIRGFECQRKMKCCDILLSNHYFHCDLYEVVPMGHQTRMNTNWSSVNIFS